MALELYYTSVPRGLRAGSSGFCTVALTRAMPAPLISQLEALSAYRPLYAAGTLGESENPVSHAHYRVNVGGRLYSVLSLVRFAGTDYSHRSNKFAHHLALEPHELSAGGPVWMVRQSNVLQSEWQGEPAQINEPRHVPQGDRPASPCRRWELVTGDAGWAGVVAERFILDATKPVYFIYESGQDLLPLFEEVIALLPPELRWRATFNTYLSQLPNGVACAWRGCVAGTRAAEEAEAARGALVLDLTRTSGKPHDSRYVSMARTGTMIELASAPVIETAAEIPVKPLKVAPAAEKPQREVYRPVRQEPGPSVSHQAALDIPMWFWLVALAWPLVVLGFGTVFYRGQVVATQDADGRARTAETRLVEVQSDNALLEKANERLDARVSELEQQLTQVQTAALEAQREKSRPGPRSRRKSIPRIATPPETVTRQPASSLSNIERSPLELPTGADARPIARRMTEVQGRWLANLPELVHPSRGVTSRSVALLSGISSGSEVELSLPTNLRGRLRSDLRQGDWQIESDSAGTSLLLRSGAGWAEIAKLRIAKGKLWWEWRIPSSVVGRTRALRGLDSLVRLGTVSMDRGPEGRSLEMQFARPVAIEIAIDQAETRSTLDETEWLALTPRDLPKGWQANAGSGPGHLILNSDSGLQLMVYPEPVNSRTELVARWVQGVPHARLARVKEDYEEVQFNWETVQTRSDSRIEWLISERSEIQGKMRRARNSAERERLATEVQEIELEISELTQTMQSERRVFEEAAEQFDQARAQVADFEQLKMIELACEHADTGALLAIVELRRDSSRGRQSQRRKR